LVLLRKADRETNKKENQGEKQRGVHSIGFG
jgi:hypothetical protein